MITKYKIAKFLIVFGFLINIANYSIDLILFYNSNDTTSIVLEEAENSEEKETSEKDDHKEKDIISQFNSENGTALLDLYRATFHFDSIYDPLVYLEHSTPPPKYS